MAFPTISNIYHRRWFYSLSGVIGAVFDAISALTISLVNRSTNSKAFVSGKSINDDATKVPNASNLADDGFFGVSDERLYDDWLCIDDSDSESSAIVEFPIIFGLLSPFVSDGPWLRVIEFKFRNDRPIDEPFRCEFFNAARMPNGSNVLESVAFPFCLLGSSTVELSSFSTLKDLSQQQTNKKSNC